MQELEPPDTHRLAAAIGWLELGNVSEARTEIETFPAELTDHPDVLEAISVAVRRHRETLTVVPSQLVDVVAAP